jgi:integrase
MNITKQQINAYINSKQNAWALSTIKSEQARLHANLELLNKGPEALYEALKLTAKPYALKTLFIRISDFLNYTFNTNTNSFKDFMTKNMKLFKYAYERAEVNIEYEKAVSLIASIEDQVIRDLARFMLVTGTRVTEALEYKNDGKVLGKGSKPRALFIPKGITYPINHNISYSKLQKELAKVSLKPHTLRKLYATKLVNEGFKEADLMKLLGWNSIITASIYLQPKNNNELQAQIERMFK